MLKFCREENPKNIVLSHNDLNISNMLKDKNDDLILLDYEYSEYNSAYYDFGNFFGEINFKLTDRPPYFVHDPNNANQYGIK